MAELRWIEADTAWEATLHHLAPGIGELSARDQQALAERVGPQSVYLKKEQNRARIVVSCARMLVEPHPWPSSIPGRETFQGGIIHTARWRDDVDLNGKDVVVIGAGSSAAQFVPSLLKEPYQVKSLIQVMRAAPWVMARLEEPFGKEDFAKYAPTILQYLPFLGWLYRYGIHVLVELVWFMLLQDKHVKWRKGMEKATLQRTYKLVPERYHRILTPDYPYGCKRRVSEWGWLVSMNQPNFTLTDRKILSVGGDCLVLGASCNSGADGVAGSESNGSTRMLSSLPMVSKASAIFKLSKYSEETASRSTLCGRSAEGHKHTWVLRLTASLTSSCPSARIQPTEPHLLS